MYNQITLDMLGYVSSIIILISMLMTSVVKLRIINSIGTTFFTIYAILSKTYPTALLNTCLVLINIYHLYRHMKQQRNSGEKIMSLK